MACIASSNKCIDERTRAAKAAGAPGEGIRTGYYSKGCKKHAPTTKQGVFNICAPEQ